MSYLESDTLQLSSRNEGQIKSYDSCFDFRAWSHDTNTRDRYLKEWIRCDMPKSVIPLSAVLGVLKNMSPQKCRKATPCCHSGCQSKVILDSICTSCNAIKECLKKDGKFEKYFIEEELETSRWPCNSCLEALKSIKMFWKVIIEKVFNINISNNLKDVSCCAPTSCRDIARIWQKDMLQQAVLVNSITCKQNKPCSKTCSRTSIPKICSQGDNLKLPSRECSKCSVKSNENHKRCKQPNCHCKKLPCTGSVLCSKNTRKKACKCTSVRAKTLDVGCNTRCESEQIKAYRRNLECLKRKYDDQFVEVQRLQNENCELKIELENTYNNWKSSIYKVGACCPSKNTISLVSKPFDCCIEGNNCSSGTSAKDTDSEMIITMKECKNDRYKHVSLLQVLHKTNQPLNRDSSSNNSCHKKEDPVELLNKVQKTLGEIFRREVSFSSCKQQRDRPSDIEATFHCVSPCRSRSCTAMSSKCRPQSDKCKPQTCFLN